MSESTPLVTVIALCYNTGRFLVEGLRSLRDQTYNSYEVVIVDDGSSDGSVELITDWMSTSSFAARLIVKDRNEGIPAALNTGVRASRGSIVTWLSDDLWDPERLELVVTCFAQLPADVGVVFGDAIVIDSDGRTIGDLRPPASLEVLGIPPGPMRHCAVGEHVVLENDFVRSALLTRCFIPAPAAAVRRSCFDKVGFYDENLAIEDLDFWLRASKAVRFAYLRAPLVRYRKHERNFTSGASLAYLEGLRKTLIKHAPSFPDRGGRVISRHVREEAYRVIVGLLGTRRITLALRTFSRFYLPHLQPTVRCLKETGRLAIALGRAMMPPTLATQER